MKSFLRVAAASLLCGTVLAGCQQKPVTVTCDQQTAAATGKSGRATEAGAGAGKTAIGVTRQRGNLTGLDRVSRHFAWHVTKRA